MSIWERIAERATRKHDDSALHRLHPELRDRVHLMSIRSDEQPPRSEGFRQATIDYQGHVWTRKAVNVIRENLAPLPMHVLRADGKPAESHPLATLMDRPNPAMQGPDLWRWWATDMMLGGEVGLEFIWGQ